MTPNRGMAPPRKALFVKLLWPLVSETHAVQRSTMAFCFDAPGGYRRVLSYSSTTVSSGFIWFRRTTRTRRSACATCSLVWRRWWVDSCVSWFSTRSPNFSTSSSFTSYVHAGDIDIIRRASRRLLQAKATSYIYRPFCVFFLWRDCSATAERISPNLHQMSSLRCYSLMVIPPWKSGPKNFGAQNVHILAKIQTPPFSDGRCIETRRNSGKTKTSGITTNI